MFVLAQGNPIIANAMKVFGYVNSFGRGINMVQEELEENKNGLATFDFKEISTFKVTVMNADLEAVKAMEDEANVVQKDGAEKNLINFNNQIDTKIKNKFDINNGAENGADGIENGIENDGNGIEKVTDRVFALINENNGISKKAIATKLGIGTTTVSRHIKILKDKGAIKRKGGDKGGYWEVKQ